MKPTFPKETPEDFPFKAGRGTALVTMYRIENKGYSEYRIPYQDGGKRRFHQFPSYDDARTKGNEMIDQLTGGHHGAITLTNDDKLTYCRALDALRPLGVPLDRAAADFAKYWQEMGGDFFKEAVAEFLKRRDTVKPLTVPELVAMFIEQKTKNTKRGRPASADYLRDVKNRLAKFAEAFQCPVTSVTPELVATFVEKMEVADRTRFNFARLIRTLFKFAQAKKFFPRDIDLMEEVDFDFEDSGEIEIFTPAEISKLLEGSRSELVPFLAIGAFAGLRHAEIKRLDWQEIDLARGWIEVKAGKAKTRSRRLIPISDNLKRWLAPHKQDIGAVVPFVNCSKQLLKLASDINAADEEQAEQGKGAKKPKLEWKHNALRHSFISYRLAELQSVDKVALEAGNSPTMIFSNYRELVTPENAKLWFSIAPKVPGNVSQMPAQKAA